MAEPLTGQPSGRLTSVDAYRGFVMLAMASGGFAFARTLDRHPEILDQFEGTSSASLWQQMWQTLAYQFSHTSWTGCSFWDLIQPSFMFLVGVAMPLSYAKRATRGQSQARRFAHVLFRSMVLILLGVFLSSNRSTQTNFTFVNVLTQIGLGYTFLYLLSLGRNVVVQLLAVAAILGGYGYYFFQYTIPDDEYQAVTTYLQEVKHKDETEWSQFSGSAAHWNKHINAAAAFDRDLLNRFPRAETPWHGRQFWVNAGGYQTLNFIPSLATMLFGLMAGQILIGGGEPGKKLKRLWMAGGLCFLVAMAIDTTIWPVEIPGCHWTLCPAVKRIWTPSWAVFSSGWTFWMLAAFYWVFDVRGCKRIALPWVVVGMNSITMYCMAQLIQPWVGRTLKTHLTTLDQALGWEPGVATLLFGGEYVYSAIWQVTARLCVLWLICVWLYRRKIFIRI